MFYKNGKPKLYVFLCSIATQDFRAVALVLLLPQELSTSVAELLYVSLRYFCLRSIN
jgi:uncharacterized protein YhaN